jgi:hypothetical protein
MRQFSETDIVRMMGLCERSNIQVWESKTYIHECHDCGHEWTGERDDECPQCGSVKGESPATGSTGWYWQTCCPGCLPDSGACGPFPTHGVCLDDATEGLD